MYPNHATFPFGNIFMLKNLSQCLYPCLLPEINFSFTTTFRSRYTFHLALTFLQTYQLLADTKSQRFPT